MVIAYHMQLKCEILQAINPFPTILIFIDLRKKAIENVGKGGNAENQHFSLFLFSEMFSIL